MRWRLSFPPVPTDSGLGRTECRLVPPPTTSFYLVYTGWRWKLSSLLCSHQHQGQGWWWWGQRMLLVPSPLLIKSSSFWVGVKAQIPTGPHRHYPVGGIGTHLLLPFRGQTELPIRPTLPQQGNWSTTCFYRAGDRRLAPFWVPLTPQSWGGEATAELSLLFLWGCCIESHFLFSLTETTGLGGEVGQRQIFH